MKNKSHLTAVSRKKLSAPMVELEYDLDRGRVLDYGCGKGFDADCLGLEKYDPYFFPEKPEGKFDVITCNYVLCVVPEDEQQAIIDDVMSMLKPGGMAYFTVRRDKKNLNGWTKRDTFQRFVEIDEEIYHESKGKFCIYQKKQMEGMIPRTFKYTLKIKDSANETNHEFREGMGVGVLYTVEATFHLTPEENEKAKEGYSLFTHSVCQYGEDILDQMIDVKIEEIK